MTRQAIPLPILSAIQANDFKPYDNGLSVSRLVDSPQVDLLKKKYKVRQSPDEMIWSLINRAMIHIVKKSSPSHGLWDAANMLFSDIKKSMAIKKSSDPDDPELVAMQNTLDYIRTYMGAYRSMDKEPWLINHAFSKVVRVSIRSVDGDRYVGNERTVFDYIHLYDRQTKTLYDLKSCSTSYYTKPHSRTLWAREANVKAWLLEQNDFPVEQVIAVMVFKDWTRHQQARSSSYPPTQMELVPLDLHTLTQTELLVTKRVEQHVRAEGGEQIRCTDADRWKAKDTFCIVRDGFKKNVIKRSLYTIEEAKQWMFDNKTKSVNASIQIEPAECKRCLSYCPVAQHCEQWKEEQERLSKVIV